MKISLPSIPKPVLIGIKIVFLIIAGYLLYTQLDWKRVKKISVDWQWIGIGFFFFNLSQFFSALRLHPYLTTIGVKIGFWAQLKLYYIGMFYNTLLPGGIGGDGYKGFIFLKKGGRSGGIVAGILLLDRFNGLIGIGIMMGMVEILKIMDKSEGWWFYLTALTLVGVGIGIGLGLIFHQKLGVIKLWQWGLGWGFGVQLLQGVAFGTVLIGIDGGTGLFSIFDYLFLFYLSSIVAIVPISIGGIGLRELTFLYGSNLLEIPSELGILASFLFFTIVTLSAGVGLFFQFGIGKWVNFEKRINKNGEGD